MSWTSLCDLDELEEGRGKYVEIGGFQLAVFLHGGAVYVMDNTCPHAGAPMAAGWVDTDTACAVCPRHNWAFRLGSGELRDMPGVALTTYKTRHLVRDGKPTIIQADLPIY
jgi:nitrite reductase/ring-hydroxylating ferredoxin subunit